MSNGLLIVNSIGLWMLRSPVLAMRSFLTMSIAGLVVKRSCVAAVENDVSDLVVTLTVPT